MTNDARPAPDGAGRTDHGGTATRPVSSPPRRDGSRPASALAALAVAAMPELRPVAVAAAEATRDGVDVAVVHDAGSQVWLVVAPRSATSGAKLEAEVQALDLLHGTLPFGLPHPSASVALKEGGRAVVFPAPRGRAIDLAALTSSPDLCSGLAGALAALHDVPTAKAESAGVPVYDDAQVRQRLRSELDRGAATGRVPGSLLTRWRAILDDRERWRFDSVVVHGDLVAERIIVAGSEVRAVLDWTELHVGDPANDLAWLAVGGDPEAVDTVLGAYREARGGAVDPFLLDRAVLHGEMALVRWLLHGQLVADESVVADAVELLAQLADWVASEDEETTGRPVGGPLAATPAGDGETGDAAGPEDGGGAEEGSGAAGTSDSVGTAGSASRHPGDGPAAGLEPGPDLAAPIVEGAVEGPAERPGRVPGDEPGEGPGGDASDGEAVGSAPRS